MGLLKRLKQSASLAPPQPVASSSRPSTPSTPDPAPSPSAIIPNAPGSGAASSRRTARPDLSPSAFSSNSIASRLSKSRWKDRRRSRTKDELVSGPAYDASPSGLSGQGVVEGERTAVSDDLNHATSTVEDEATNQPLSPINFKARPSSDEYKQEGGILGRLNFESLSQRPAQEDGDQLHPWLGAASQDERAAERDSVIAVDKEEAEAPRTSEEVEVLESAEKKSKFWRGKGRIRRMSKARSEIEDDLPAADGSPTPHKVSLPPVEPPLEVRPAPPTELQHPRPQTLRRPSSSFFHNTFARSISRTSMTKDIEIPISTEDDGSFQLKAFRHVSGTADVDVFNQYAAQQSLSKDQTASVSPTTPGLALGIEKTTTPSIPPPSAYYNSLPRPRIPSSRPASAAGSNTSLDELMIASPKISAGAFRRAARRQSENVLVPMEPNTKPVEDDDDDLPLAMTKGRRRMSVVSMPVGMVDTTPTAPTMQANGSLPIQPEVKVDSPTETEENAPKKLSSSADRSRTNSISPSPSFTLLKQTDKLSSSKGFVVKSATSTRQERHIDLARAQSMSRPPAFDSPVSTKPSTPVPPDEPEILLSPMDIQEIEKTLAPPLISPNDKRAQPQAVVSQRGAQTPSPVSAEKAATPSQVRSPPPPVAPLVLPQPGDTTPSSTDLPLPPDQMPATPPPLSSLPSCPPSRSVSPGKKKTSPGILEEPLRVISAFWAASPPENPSPEKTPRRGSQPVDTPVAGPSSTPRGSDIIARPRSVPLKSSSPVWRGDNDEEDELELWAVRSQHLLSDGSGDERVPSRMTLFDASAASSPSLRNKLSASSMKALESQAKGPASRSSLSSLNTNIDRAQQAGTSTDGPPSATPLATGFRGRPQALAQGSKPIQPHRKAAWSSSESDSGAETESPSPRPPARVKGSVRRVPQGPRKISESAPSSPEKARKAGRRVSGPRAPRRLSTQRRTVPSDSSSGDEKLSTLRERVSSSRLSQYTVSPERSTVALPTSPRHQPGPSTSSGFSASPQEAAHSYGHPGQYPPGNISHGPLGPSQGHTIPGRPAFHRTTTSPGSSRSGRTSESFGQHILTPRSGDGLDGQGGYTDTEPRQRRLSSAFHWSGMTAPGPPIHQGPDPNLMRTAMKQAWQAQFMAVAYRASEEEWERASSIRGDHASPSRVPPPFPAMPYGMPSFPYGYPMPYPPPSTLFQYPYPPPSVPLPYAQQFPAPDLGGYQFAPDSQSVFGGDFGPPSQLRQGLVQPPGPNYAQHTTSRRDPGLDHGRDVKSAMGTRGQFDDPETPRKTRRSSTILYAN